MGFIDNTHKSIVGNITKHGLIVLYLGDVDELCLTKGNSKDITIYIREGFMRLAIEKEYRIVPTLIPFEEDSYIPLFTKYNWLKHLLWTKYRLSVAPHIGSYGIFDVSRQTHKPTIHFCKEVLCTKDSTVDEVSELFKQSLSDKCNELGIKHTFVSSKKHI